MPSYAGVECTREQVRGTLKLLGYYRRFLASDCERCRDPEDVGYWADQMTKDQARRRLSFLIHCAISRKAGIPDVRGRKQDPDYQVRLRRDCRAVRDAVNRRIIVRQFETPEIRERFGHLLTRPEDE